MSYLVLARKYRPQSFDDLVGQEHVAKTLGQRHRQPTHCPRLCPLGPAGVRQNHHRADLGPGAQLREGPHR
jgi:replication-associated recombination protein RarA